MVLPIAYMAPKEWYRAYLSCPEGVEIEGLESFEKQTCRNRCIIGDGIRLTVPVKKVEHKQLTRDIEISYQTRWQHQHWISLVSVYKNTPFFDYYAEFFRPYYEKEIKYLWDLNTGLHETIMALLHNERPTTNKSMYGYKCTADFRNEELNQRFGTGESILDILFEYGPESIERL